jgi:hypothetical protein
MTWRIDIQLKGMQAGAQRASQDVVCGNYFATEPNLSVPTDEHRARNKCKR